MVFFASKSLGRCGRRWLVLLAHAFLDWSNLSMIVNRVISSNCPSGKLSHQQNNMMNCTHGSMNSPPLRRKFPSDQITKDQAPIPD